VENFSRFLAEAGDLVARYGGSLSGEHGDGQLRANQLVKMYGAELVRGFAEFKAIFDPGGRMNPGKVVAPYSPVQNLRLAVRRFPGLTRRRERADVRRRPGSSGPVPIARKAASA
jgi:hypothetical protein